MTENTEVCLVSWEESLLNAVRSDWTARYHPRLNASKTSKQSLRSQRKQRQRSSIEMRLSGWESWQSPRRPLTTGWVGMSELIAVQRMRLRVHCARLMHQERVSCRLVWSAIDT